MKGFLWGVENRKSAHCDLFTARAACLYAKLPRQLGLLGLVRGLEKRGFRLWHVSPLGMRASSSSLLHLKPG